MFKEAYPDKYLFAGRQGEIYRAFMFQVGGTEVKVTRDVPDILAVFAESGGLRDTLSLLGLLINTIFFLPIDRLEEFFAM